LDERLAFRGTNERLGLLAPGGSDGPNGIRAGGLTIEQAPVTSGRSANATAFPNVIALGATWDRELARRFGEAVGEEFHGKGMASVTGPTINLLRTWHWGRTAETFSEDPYLMSELVVPEVSGIQSRRVIAVAKHFAGNNQENTRTGWRLRTPVWMSESRRRRCTRSTSLTSKRWRRAPATAR
jgi:beta-glucosidase